MATEKEADAAVAYIRRTRIAPVQRFLQSVRTLRLQKTVSPEGNLQSVRTRRPQKTVSPEGNAACARTRWSGFTKSLFSRAGEALLKRLSRTADSAGRRNPRR